MAHYSKRYAGGFVDLPSQTTLVDSTFLNAVESALLTLYGTDPAASNYVPAWNGTSFVPKLLDTSNISATAAITKSQLASLGIVNADVAVGAAIDPAKLASGLLISQLNGYPSDATKFARGDGTWAAPPSQLTLYRKTTSKAATTAIETDLLNGEITVGAGVMGTTGRLRLTAWGDNVFTAGAGQNTPRLKLVFGGTTVFDTNVIATAFGSGTVRGSWHVIAEILNLGAANSQWCVFRGMVAKLGADGGFGSVGTPVNFTTGQGFMVIDRTANVYSRAAMEGVNSAAVDTTAAKTLTLTTTNGSGTSTDMTLRGAVVEIM